MNRRIGHEATDRLLAALAQVLQSYPRHVQGALTGRLNGSDFALYLPASGMAEESARSLLQALRAALATVDREADLVDRRRRAAAALQRGSRLVAGRRRAGAGRDRRQPLRSCMRAGRRCSRCTGRWAKATGRRGWPPRCASAVRGWSSSRCTTARGELLHLDCPMQLQLEPDGAFEPAARWLAHGACAAGWSPRPT